MEKISAGDFVWIHGLKWLLGKEVEGDLWGVVIDYDEDEDENGTPYRVAIWNEEGKYQGQAWCWGGNLSKMMKVVGVGAKKSSGEREKGLLEEKNFWPGDKVRMVDGMEGRLLNSWGMMFEWGVVKEVERNKVRVGFWKDGMEKVEYWCLEEQLEKVERGESGK